jgi:hypothetical protein
MVHTPFSIPPISLAFSHGHIQGEADILPLAMYVLQALDTSIVGYDTCRNFDQ